MTTIHTSLSLKGFDVMFSKRPTDVQQVRANIADMISWLKNEEQLFYATDFDSLVRQVLENGVNLKGSANSLARKLGVNPTNKYQCQTHNMSEMFRTNVVSKLLLYVQDTIIDESGDASASNVLSLFKTKYPHLKPPTYQYILRRLTAHPQKTVPSASGVLHFSSCDMHFSQIKVEGEHILWSVKLPTSGLTTLRFRVPDKQRFKEQQKFSRPSVRLNSVGELVFQFTGIKRIEVRPSTTVLGVDIGKVEPFVATVLNEKNRGFSSPVYCSRQTSKINDRINKLYRQRDSNRRKAIMCRNNGHVDKAEVLETEAKRIRTKITRLKVERSISVARDITATAQHFNSEIVLEYLSWSKSGHWERSIVQDRIENKAKRKGVKTRKVSAKDTSTKCAKCGSPMKARTGRKKYCPNCQTTIDRDVNASRNIALRALKHKKTLASFRQILSANKTRLSRSASNPGLNLTRVQESYSDCHSYSNTKT